MTSAMSSQQARDQVQSAHDPRSLVRDLLLQAGNGLPASARTTILELNASAVPSLVEILEDEELLPETAPGEGFAPIHAVELLTAIGATEGVEPILRVLVRTHPLSMLRDRIMSRLGPLGEPVVEPALKAHTETKDSDHQSALCSILASTRVRDERIFQLLLRQLIEEPEVGAMNLAEYGDPRALPDLSRAFDRYEVVVPGNMFSNHCAIELRAAIEELGGTLTPEQKAKDERAGEPAARFREQIASALGETKPSPPKKMSRNDPCWCGSGKKYKKCHPGTPPSA